MTGLALTAVVTVLTRGWATLAMCDLDKYQGTSILVIEEFAGKRVPAEDLESHSYDAPRRPASKLTIRGAKENPLVDDSTEVPDHFLTYVPRPSRLTLIWNPICSR